MRICEAAENVKVSIRIEKYQRGLRVAGRQKIHMGSLENETQEPDRLLGATHSS